MRKQRQQNGELNGKKTDMSFLTLAQRVDVVIAKEQDIAVEINEIIETLGELNSSFKKPKEITSIVNSLHRARDLSESGIAKKVVKELLVSARSLMIFEALKLKYLKVKRDKKKFEFDEEDIARVKSTNWLRESKSFQILIVALERVVKKNNAQFEVSVDEIEGAGNLEEIKTARKTKMFSPMHVIHQSVNKIRTQAKLVLTVKYMQVIAEDFLERKGVKLPGGKACFSEEAFSKDYDVRIAQIIYNLGQTILSTADIIVQERYGEVLGIKETLRDTMFEYTNMFDPVARVPLEISDDTKHLVYAYCHVIVELKRLVDINKVAQGVLNLLWPAYYKKSFKDDDVVDPNKMDKSSMLSNLKFVLDRFEQGLQEKAYDSEEEQVVEQVVELEVVIADEEEEDSSLGDSFGCG